MIKEHDRVVLRKEVPEQGLKTGDVGTVNHVHKKGEAFEVEFVALDGETLAIATLDASRFVRFREKKSRPHVRYGRKAHIYRANPLPTGTVKMSYFIDSANAGTQVVLAA
jgi:hypothetical protein